MFEPAVQRSAPRSYLYVPGDRADRLEGAAGRTVDALVLDLEDAVAAPRKDTARDLARAWLEAHPERASSTWVRINADAIEQDVRVVLGTAAAGVMLPSATPGLVDAAASALGIPPIREAGAAPGIIALVESAEGILCAEQIARHHAVDRLAVGRADLVADLRWDVAPESPELAALLLPIVLASAAAGIDAPIAPTSLEFRDLDAMRRSTAWYADRGFRARTAIHPAQVEAVHAGLAPSDEALAKAREIATAYAEGLARASGVAVAADGGFIDRAVARSAFDVLARAGEPFPTGG